jgi:hypothetical protein|tara:strand:+ start:514 stop:711 length:198 start_codon:yes stop_codon:yes gene_type:complete
MTLTEQHKNQLNDVAERIMLALQDQILDTIEWQIDDDFAESMTEDQYREALVYTYDEVLAGLTEK